MATTLRPAKKNFLVRIGKQKQKNRLEKQGLIYLPVQREIIGMTRFIQSGEIMAIGELAAKAFPQASIGDELLFHHFIENKKDDFWQVDEDDDYNYYVVPAMKTPSGYQPTFGLFNGKKFIMHPDYVMFKGPRKINRSETKKLDSLHLFTNYKMTRDEIVYRLKELEDERNQVAQGTNFESQARLRELENYCLQLSAQLNKKEYIPLEVVATNPELDKWFGRKIKEGDTMYCANYATDYLLTFKEIDYRIVEVNHIGGLVA